MPELPEVETVRRGLHDRVVGRTLGPATVAHPRAVRRQAAGAGDFIARTSGMTVTSSDRRGKYLWLTLAGVDHVLVAHLGMSGQFRVLDPRQVEPAADPHARVWWPLDDGMLLVFRDQRTFGWVLVDEMVGQAPAAVSHIALDPFDPLFDADAAIAAIRRSRSGIKRVLLAQTTVSGIGNIYADEALWRARLHPETPADRLSRPRTAELLAAATAVMGDALSAGGTSFDPLYVAINGESGGSTAASMCMAAKGNRARVVAPRSCVSSSPIGRHIAAHAASVCRGPGRHSVELRRQYPFTMRVGGGTLGPRRFTVCAGGHTWTEPTGIFDIALKRRRDKGDQSSWPRLFTVIWGRPISDS